MQKVESNQFEMWIMMNYQLQKAYTPNAGITVDEQLFPYCGRAGFMQYNPYLCNLRFFHQLPSQGQICTGKRPNVERELTNVKEWYWIWCKVL